VGCRSILLEVSNWEFLIVQLIYKGAEHHRRNSGSDSGRTGKDFPKYGALGSILSGRKW
jgi:hypothetical protein